MADEKDLYDIELCPDSNEIGGAISIVTGDMFPDKEDVKQWLEALERREDKEAIQIAIYDCKFYLGYVN